MKGTPVVLLLSLNLPLESAHLRQLGHERRFIGSLRRGKVNGEAKGSEGAQCSRFCR